MDADKSRPVRRPPAAAAKRAPVRRPRKLARPELDAGPQQQVRDLLHDLHETANRPALEDLEKRIAGDDRLDGSPKKDVIHRIISRGGPAALDDVRAVAQTLARACGQDEYTIAAQVTELMLALHQNAVQQRQGNRDGGGYSAPIPQSRRQLGRPAVGQASVSGPVMVGVVPPLGDCRQDRPADDDLTAALGASETVVVGQVLAGLGGVGKTQLAAGLAHRWWTERRVDLLVWVTATSRTSIITAYADAAVRVTGVKNTDDDRGAARFLAWLSEPHGWRWLIVLDDVADPADLTLLWPPSVADGRTVATSRCRDAALLGGRHLIDVDVFTPEQATAYLREKLAVLPQGLDEADELAADLGYLPLALAQAATFIADNGARMTCATYRRRLADQRRKLHDLAPSRLPDNHRDTVAATWEVSIDRAETLAPVGVARPVLELAALLDPNGIPAELFTSTAVTSYYTARLGRLIDAEDATDALHVLRRFSLLTIDEDTNIIRVHGLLQRAVREATHPDQQRRLARAAADALIEQWPDIERDSGHAQVLRANTIALDSNAGSHLWTSANGGHPVLSRVGRSLGGTGLVTAAATYFDHLHSTAVDRLGSDHRDTFNVRADLVRWRGQAGDLAEAVTTCEQLLADRVRVLGPDHADTLSTRNLLAYWRGEAGDPAGAAEALAHLVDHSQRVLGPDHFGTLDARHYHAVWRGRAGDPAGAAAALAHLREDIERVLGPDHPETLAVRHDLALSQGSAGDPTGAADAYTQLRDDRERVLGPDHPDTLTTRHDLALWRGQAGDRAGAFADLEQLLADRVRVLGPDHPRTFTTRYLLAAWRGEAGDRAGAVADLEELHHDRVRVLGPDHPDTLTTRYFLARWRGKAGDAARAAADLEELLHDRVRVFGPDHPYTLDTRHELASWRGKAGDWAGAVTTLEQFLDDWSRVLGPDHPHTLDTRHDLALWRGEAGNRAGAVADLEQLLKDRVRVFGSNHPYTLINRRDLAICRGRAGDRAGAVAALEQLLHDWSGIYGPDHRGTRTIRQNLAYWRQQTDIGNEDASATQVGETNE